MKIIQKYIDEISGKEFATHEEAAKSEKKNGGIKKLFSFWEKVPKDNYCRFTNGGWCYQRTEKSYYKLVGKLVGGVRDYEPYIAKQYESEGGLQQHHMQGGFLIGRYLCDGNSELNQYYLILSNICCKCFREWGQPYYAMRCECTTRPKAIREGVDSL